MFGKMMNSFYYGKSGKGDFRKEDLPKNRWQLFWEMLRVRFASLCRLNLMTVAAWLPTILVIGFLITNTLSVFNSEMSYLEYLENGTVSEQFTEEQAEVISKVLTDTYGEEADKAQAILDYSVEAIKLFLFKALLLLIPCIAITGPVQAGLAYVTRNWSRDEHAFIWADFKDAVKDNWKQGLGVSAITSILPIIMYVGYQFYGQQATNSMFFMVPQMLILMVGVVWALGLTFMYPMMVSYRVSFGQLIKNSVVIAIGRLPQTVGIRLIMLVPTIICLAVFMFTGSLVALLALPLYYVLIGFALARFVYASFTNGVFDRFINSRMEGVEINRGLAKEEDLDEEDEEENAQETDQPQ